LQSASQRSVKIIKRLQEAYPQAGPMLKFSSRFELLVAVVLSAQSTDEQVNRVTAALFREANTPEALAAMEQSELEEKIKGVGLYKNKARSIKNLSLMLLEQYNGEVPGNYEALLQLPGVGTKSANVVMAVGFGQPGLGVDTHVHRVTNRLGIVHEKTPEKTEKALKALLPEKLWSISHHLFIFHGRQVCKARRPDCDHCCVEDLCAKVLPK
jgi:endonuclease-3